MLDLRNLNRVETQIMYLIVTLSSRDKREFMQLIELPSETKEMK